MDNMRCAHCVTQRHGCTNFPKIQAPPLNFLAPEVRIEARSKMRTHYSEVTCEPRSYPVLLARCV